MWGLKVIVVEAPGLCGCLSGSVVGWTSMCSLWSRRQVQEGCNCCYTTDSTARSFRVIQAPNPCSRFSHFCHGPRGHLPPLCRAVCSSGSVPLTANVPGLPCLSLLSRGPKKPELNLCSYSCWSWWKRVSRQFCPPLAPRLSIWPWEHPLCLT